MQTADYDNAVALGRRIIRDSVHEGPSVAPVEPRLAHARAEAEAVSKLLAEAESNLSEFLERRRAFNILDLTRRLRSIG